MQFKQPPQALEPQPKTPELTPKPTRPKLSLKFGAPASGPQ